jgi:hypothetical protein
VPLPLLAVPVRAKFSFDTIACCTRNSCRREGVRTLQPFSCFVTIDTRYCVRRNSSLFKLSTASDWSRDAKLLSVSGWNSPSKCFLRRLPKARTRLCPGRGFLGRWGGKKVEDRSRASIVRAVSSALPSFVLLQWRARKLEFSMYSYDGYRCGRLD